MCIFYAILFFPIFFHLSQEFFIQRILRALTDHCTLPTIWAYCCRIDRSLVIKTSPFPDIIAQKDRATVITSAYDTSVEIIPVSLAAGIGSDKYT